MRDKAKSLDYPVYVFLWEGWADDGDQEKVLNRKGTFPLLSVPETRVSEAEMCRE